MVRRWQWSWTTASVRPALRKDSHQEAELKTDVHLSTLHVHHPDPSRFNTEQEREGGAAPELLLGRQQKVLVERVATDGDLDPLSTTGDD
jgi:hypothetical protein